ncbi:MAG: RHS repeat-associated core domain-containing protein [Methanobacteriota archaeon]|nr:MAG: RHS repeat-associated core domain-containing protein [Euryarchaeota archaeon]
MDGLTQRSNDPDDRYLYSGKELDREHSLRWYYFGARYYHPALGRWLAVDPLWEKYPGWNPYNYTANDPINKSDPDGRFVQALVGAAVGAAVEFGAQVAVSMANGQSFSEAVSNVDLVDVGIAAAAGAVSGGLSTVSKLGTAGRALMSAGISVAEGAAKANLGSSKSDYSIRDGAFDALTGAGFSKISDKAQELIKANSKEFKVLTKTAKKLGNIAREGRPRRAQTERYQQALKAVQNYGSTQANAISQAGSGILNTVKGVSGSTCNSNSVILNQGSSQTPSDHTRVVVTIKKEDRNQ